MAPTGTFGHSGLSAGLARERHPVTTYTDIVNRAVMMVDGNLPLVTGSFPNFDSSKEGKAAAVLLPGVIGTVGREFEWDFARVSLALVLTGNTAPAPWALEYEYPPTCIQLWQVLDPTEDPDDPLPIDWNVGNAVWSAAQQRVIWTNVANAVGVYNDMPAVAAWDTMFQEAVVRLLASELSIALIGRPDSAEAYLRSGSAFETLGEQRTD